MNPARSQPNIPAPPPAMEPVTRNYMTVVVRSILSALAEKLDQRSPAGSILLASPNGSVYTVKVADDGSLVTELVYDAS